MDTNGFSFFTDELDDLNPMVPIRASSSPRPRLPDEAELFEGEAPPESALQAIRSWFGF